MDWKLRLTTPARSKLSLSNTSTSSFIARCWICNFCLINIIASCTIGFLSSFLLFYKYSQTKCASDYWLTPHGFQFHLEFPQVFCFGALLCVIEIRSSRVFLFKASAKIPKYIPARFERDLSSWLLQFVKVRGSWTGKKFVWQERFTLSIYPSAMVTNVYCCRDKEGLTLKDGMAWESEIVLARLLLKFAFSKDCSIGTLVLILSLFVYAGSTRVVCGALIASCISGLFERLVGEFNESDMQQLSLCPAALKAALAFNLLRPCPVFAHALLASLHCCHHYIISISFIQQYESHDPLVVKILWAM